MVLETMVSIRPWPQDRLPHETMTQDRRQQETIIHMRPWSQEHGPYDTMVLGTMVMVTRPWSQDHGHIHFHITFKFTVL